MSRSPLATRRTDCALALLPCLLAACLGRTAEEQPGYSPAVLSKDAKVPRIDDDKALSQRLDLADGVMGTMVPLRTGFANGAEVHYWDFGTAVATAEPVWEFRRRGAGGKVEDIGHLDLVDSAPGDMSYSPFRVIYQVLVTPAYDGQRITSLQALDDAIEIGLVHEPVRTKTFVNWPMALAATKLDQGEGKPPLSPHSIYYHGHIASYFAPDQRSYEFAMEPIKAPNAYVLRKQNGAGPLDEAALHSDLDGDGDQTDSNVIFQVADDAMTYVSIWHEVDVTVASDYAFASSRSESDLFEHAPMKMMSPGGMMMGSGGMTGGGMMMGGGMMGLGPAKSTVIAYADNGMLLNRILQPEAP